MHWEQLVNNGNIDIYRSKVVMYPEKWLEGTARHEVSCLSSCNVNLQPDM